MKTPIILASASPRRKMLLEKHNITCAIEESSYEETPKEEGKSPLSYAMLQALCKASDVALSHKDAIIIAADTVVTIDNKILGKPENRAHAKEMLKLLSGKTHEVITAFAIIHTRTQETVTDSETTKVTMKDISQEAIDDYIATGQADDKAGGYGIQDGIGAFVAKIEGDYENVIGLPISKMLPFLTMMQKL